MPKEPKRRARGTAEHRKRVESNVTAEVKVLTLTYDDADLLLWALEKGGRKSHPLAVRLAELIVEFEDSSLRAEEITARANANSWWDGKGYLGVVNAEIVKFRHARKLANPEDVAHSSAKVVKKAVEEMKKRSKAKKLRGGL